LGIEMSEYETKSSRRHTVFSEACLGVVRAATGRCKELEV